MTDAERFEFTRLFVGALAAVQPEQEQGKPVPFDPRAFAEVVAEEAKRDNRIAMRFAVFPTVSGKRCPDFQYGLTIAQSAGLISRQNPSFESFSVLMPPRQRRELEAHSLFQNARSIAQLYLEATLGLKQAVA